MSPPAVLPERGFYPSSCLVLFGMILSSLPVHGEDVFKLINTGDAAVARGDSNAAVSAYSRAIELDPQQPLAYTKRAAAYTQQHKHSLALRDLDHALALEPSSVSSRTKRGQLHLQLCNFAAAERDFEAILAAKPDHKSTKATLESLQQGRASLERAKVHLEHQNIRETDNELSKVYRISSNCLPARLMSARMFLLEQKVEEAVAETGRILKMDPSNEEALLMRGQGYYLMEDFDMAKRHYGEILTNYNPDNKQAKQLFSQLKSLQRRLNNVAAAVGARQWSEVETDAGDLLREVEEQLRNKRGDLWLYLARARYHLKREDDSIVEAADSSLHYGYRSDAVVLKAKTFIRAERWEAAIQVLETTINEHGREQELINMLQQAQTGLKISKQKDYYKILGVPREVDEKTLKRAYRRLALLHHPDKIDGEENKAAAEKKFAEINEAYEILSNPEKRALHDMGEDPNDPNAGQQHGFHGFHGGFQGFHGNFHGFQQGGHTFHF